MVIHMPSNLCYSYSPKAVVLGNCNWLTLSILAAKVQKVFLSVVCLMIVIHLDYTILNERMIVNYELERMWKEAAADYLKALS